MNNFNFLYPKRWQRLGSKQGQLLVVVLVFGIAGTYFLMSSNAATPASYVAEAEDNTVVSPATTVNDSNASGGGAVKFTAPMSGGCIGATGQPGGTDPWGGCWPGPNNTGVPAGTTLTNMNGDLVVSADNAIVSGKNVNGCISVEAIGVTVKNSKAKCITTSQSSRARNPANPPLIIQDSEVDCQGTPGNTGTAIGDMNINVYRVNIHNCENGFDIDNNSLIQDSYIHDLYNSATGDPHTDGLQSGVGSFLTITHNVFFGFNTGCVYPNDGSCNGTSAINIFNAPSGPTVHDTTVSKNLLAGGSYALYCPRVSTTNFNIRNNRFSTVYSLRVGEYGPSSDCYNETLSGNVYNETGQPITLD